MLYFVLNRCLDGRLKSEGETTNLKVGWESFSKFGNPWPYFASFGGKTLGSRTHGFASESPWNDQFSNVGSFAIPRVFHKRTSFRSRPIWPSRTNLKPEGPIWGHVITARSLALTFGTRREVLPTPKNWINYENILLFILNVFNM